MCSFFFLLSKLLSKSIFSLLFCLHKRIWITTSANLFRENAVLRPSLYLLSQSCSSCGNRILAESDSFSISSKFFYYFSPSGYGIDPDIKSSNLFNFRDIWIKKYLSPDKEIFNLLHTCLEKEKRKNYT